MADITTTLTVTVKDGPKITMLPVETKVTGYDKFDVLLDGTEGFSQTIGIQPDKGTVEFLLITASVYPSDKAGFEGTLTYAPEGKSPITLGSPQLYTGASSIAALLGDVQKISLNSTLNQVESDTSKAAAAPESESAPSEDAAHKRVPLAVNISVLVGRNATTKTPPAP